MPGERFIASRAVLDETLTAGEVVTVDLGVNGISALAIHITAQQTADNTAADLADILSIISRFEVLWNGQAIVSGNGTDLAMIGQIITGHPTVYVSATEAANADLGVTLLIPFARSLLARGEGLPKVRRGELQLQFTTIGTYGDADTGELEIEQFEIPDDNPSRYLKYTTFSATPAATGDYDIELPIGNYLLGLLAWLTTPVLNMNTAATITFARVLANNTEYGYAACSSPILSALGQMRGPTWVGAQAHGHVSDLGAAYAQFQPTGIIPIAVGAPATSYLWMDYDPTRDGRFAIDTRQYDSIKLRATIGAAEALRVVPVELVGTL